MKNVLKRIKHLSDRHVRVAEVFSVIDRGRSRARAILSCSHIAPTAARRPAAGTQGRLWARRSPVKALWSYVGLDCALDSSAVVGPRSSPRIKGFLVHALEHTRLHAPTQCAHRKNDKNNGFWPADSGAAYAFIC